MEFIKILSYFFVSFLSLLLTFYVSKKFNLYDLPDGKKIHSTKTPNIGGLALIFLILFSILINDISKDLEFIYYLCCFVVLIGFYDDLKNLNVIKKLLFISIPVISFIYHVSLVDYLGSFFSYNLYLGKFSFFYTFMCILLLMNAVNYMDGMDGLLSILIILSLTYIFLLLPLHKTTFFLPIICFLIVFLFFNLNILPKQFLGDSGSLGLGFILASLSIYYTQYENLIHPSIIIWCLCFYVYEFLTINILRIKNKKNVFKKDLDFIFNLLNKNNSTLVTITICCIIKIFFLLNGLIINHFELYNFSIMIFIIYFFIYLYLRLKQAK
tara:strand:- start:5713 stop:6690 length:978 start_codon:yes stop_codon:yes gene_type:complete